MFFGYSGSNCNAFYLYSATKAGLGGTPHYVHAQAYKGVWFLYSKVRTLHHEPHQISNVQTNYKKYLTMSIFWIRFILATQMVLF